MNTYSTTNKENTTNTNTNTTNTNTDNITNTNTDCTTNTTTTTTDKETESGSDTKENRKDSEKVSTESQHCILEQHPGKEKEEGERGRKVRRDKGKEGWRD